MLAARFAVLEGLERRLDDLIETDSTQQVLRVTVGGIVTEREFDKLYDRVAGLCAVYPPNLAIVDFTTVTQWGPSAEFAVNVAWRSPAIPPSAIRVIVAPQPHIYGMARMVEAYRFGMDGKFHVVRTIEECYPILGIKKLEFSSGNM
jgi:hypothetical protein